MADRVVRGAQARREGTAEMSTQRVIKVCSHARGHAGQEVLALTALPAETVRMEAREVLAEMGSAEASTR